MSKNLEYYLNLRYRIQLDQEADGTFVAHHPDLSGCIAEGETASEAVDNLCAARELWISVRLEDQLPVPEPVTEPEYSGRLLVRMPKSLHGALARLAENEGTSLNQLIVSALSAHTQNPSYCLASAEDLFSDIYRQVATHWRSRVTSQLVSAQQAQWSCRVVQSSGVNPWHKSYKEILGRTSSGNPFWELCEGETASDLTQFVTLLAKKADRSAKEDRDEDIVVA